MNTAEMISLLSAYPFIACYANDNDAWIPEMWANESLMILEESVVMSNLVHRDFENEVRNFGDVVNTRRPAKFVHKRKVDADNVVEQDAISANVQVPLDQHNYTSFIIKDGEGSKSFAELVQVYLMPAIQSVGRGVDRSIVGQAHRFLSTGPTRRVGGLNTMSASNVRERIVDCREQLNVQNVPEDDMRYIVVTPQTEGYMLKTDLFVKSNEAGTSAALRRAEVGQLFGFGIFAANNTPAATTGDVVTGTITNAIAAGAAAASQACTITGYEVQPGEWFVIEGNDQPMYATAATASTNTTAITPNEASKNASAATAPVTVYTNCDVDGAYAAGYSKEVTLDGYTVAPSVGRLISFGTGATRHTYTIIEATIDGASVDVLLDRPLEYALTDNQLAFPGPTGQYNLAFHRNSLALVTRPLALPNTALGAMSAVASDRGLSMRVVMQYDSVKQGTRVTCDVLSGVALLDVNMGCLLLG
jgi:hypothetical protein